MAEYIEREAAYAELTGYYHHRTEVQHKALREALGRIPAADVKPVVRAIWRYKTMTVPGGKGQTYAKWCCTACRGKVKEKTNYCPYCGADMRGHTNEEN